MIGHLADMDQAVLMDADVDEDPDSGHVGDYALQYHSFAQIVELVDTLGELDDLELFARIAARLGEFFGEYVDHNHRPEAVLLKTRDGLSIIEEA